MWPNRDPIGENGGINLYSMVENDPINTWDSLGNDKCGKENINANHGGETLTRNSTEEQVQKALDEARQRGMSRKHVNNLRGLLKVVKRGGRLIPLLLCPEELILPPELPPDRVPKNPDGKCPDGYEPVPRFPHPDGRIPAESNDCVRKGLIV